MPTPWDEAVRCPEDGSSGIIVERKGFQGGQLVILSCPNTRCMMYETGWFVQIRPDGTIPDRVSIEDRRKDAGPKPKVNQAAAQRARDMIAQQVADEQKPGSEIRAF